LLDDVLTLCAGRIEPVSRETGTGTGTVDITPACQTRLYAEGQLIGLPLHEEEIATDPNLVTIRLRE